MRLVVQSVSQASCIVDEKVTGQISNGYMVLVGIGLDDNKQIVEKMANKLSKLRVIHDEQGKLNLSVVDTNGSILSISQFTLYADCAKGNRPSFNNAIGGQAAKDLYLYFNECLRNNGLHVEEGIFGADMHVSLTNEGPITIIMDSKDIL